MINPDRLVSISRRAAICAAVAVTTLFGVVPAAAAPTGDPVGHACSGVQAFFEVPRQNVEQFLPEADDRFRPAEPNASAGLGEVFVNTVFCDEGITVGARTRDDVGYAIVGITIEPPPASAPGTVHFYLVSWVSDDQDFTSWLKGGTGLDDRVRLVRGLSQQRTDLGGGTWTWRFDAPDPSPTPFVISATAKDGASTGLLANYWHETSAGTVRIRSTQPALTSEAFGASSGTLTPHGDSDLAQMLGTEAARDFVGTSVYYDGGGFSKSVS